MRAVTSIAVVLVLLNGCDSDDGSTVTVEADAGAIELHVEVAEGDDELAEGLSGREAIADDEGLLMVFPEEGRPALWMRDTGIALSAAFLSADGVILDLVDLEPYSLEVRHGPAGSRYALEVARGWFERVGVSAGDRVDLSTALR